MSNVEFSNDGFSATIETTFKSFEGEKIYDLLEKLNLIPVDYHSFIDKAVKDTSFSSTEMQTIVVNFPFSIERKTVQITDSWQIYLLEERKPEIEEKITKKN